VSQEIRKLPVTVADSQEFGSAHTLTRISCEFGYRLSAAHRDPNSCEFGYRFGSTVSMCAVQRCRFSVGAIPPGKGSLQPEQSGGGGANDPTEAFDAKSQRDPASR